MTKVIQEIAIERARQIKEEGWTAHHDDQHDRGQMAKAAAAYAIHSANFRDTDTLGGNYRIKVPEPNWPWDIKWWKPKNPRRDLIRAAALIIAEIERLDRASPPKESADG